MLHLGLQAAERLHEFRVRRGLGGHGLGADNRLPVLNGDLQPVIFPAVVRALQGKGAVEQPPRQGQVLMAGEQDVEIQLLA